MAAFRTELVEVGSVEVETFVGDTSIAITKNPLVEGYEEATTYTEQGYAATKAWFVARGWSLTASHKFQDGGWMYCAPTHGAFSRSSHGGG